jgi:hypothetical protein
VPSPDGRVAVDTSEQPYLEIMPGDPDYRSAVTSAADPLLALDGVDLAALRAGIARCLAAPPPEVSRL